MMFSYKKLEKYNIVLCLIKSVQIQYLNISMQSPQFQEKPIQLVYVTPEGKYQLHPKAESFLKKVPKPICVISVAGLYRTGKSYLLNRILLNRNNGFGVGPTINPCTKGLWCWGVPLKGTDCNGEKTNILIIDSEGIGALDEDQNHDVKIFTLAILTSSIFIYNSVGSIDQNALQNLSLVVNLTKNIELSTQDNADQDPEELARYFPTFFWVVRDFSLQLINSQGDSITPKDYLERALAPQKGFSDDVQQKNRIRRLLTSFFKDRQCATLVRPIVHQQKLQHLSECSFDDLRPQFVQQALNLRKKVFTNAKPKMIRGQYLDGTMYISMLNSYLTSINSGGVPNIQNAWTYMCIEKCMKLQEQCYDLFIEETGKAFNDNLPCSNEQFQSQIQQIQKECLRIFSKQQIGQESQEYLSELKQKIKQKIAILRIQNQKQSINVLKNYIIKNFTVIQKKMRMNQYENYQEFLKSVNHFYLHLLENGPDLPKKEIVYLDFLKKVTSQGAEIFLKQINQNLESLKNISQQKERVLTGENQEIRAKLKQEHERSKQQLETLNLQKAQSEKKLKQTQQTHEKYKQSSKLQLSKMQEMYQNKIKINLVHLDQMKINLDEIKDKKVNIQSSYIFEKRQREKQKALTDLKMNQLKEQLKMLKLKDKNQQIQISQLTFEMNNKIKEANFSSENKIAELARELKNIKDKYQEALEQNDHLNMKLQNIEKSTSISTKRCQQELKNSIEKFENYKLQFQSDKLVRLQILEEQNKILKDNINIINVSKNESQKLHREMIDKTKSISSDYEKQVAILNQKLEFLQQQYLECKQSYKKNVDYYETSLKNRIQVQEEQLRKVQKEELKSLEEQHSLKIRQLQNELSTIKQKYNSDINNKMRMVENANFQFELQIKRFEVEIKNKTSTIELLEDQKNKIYHQKQKIMLDQEELLRQKEGYYQQKIKELEYQLQIAIERASEEQSQNNNKSQQSLKQLKNYYELQRQKLELRIVSDKEKFDKKIDKMRQQYESQIEEQRNTAEQQYDNLRDEFNNEVTMLKDLVANLQHENEAKTKMFDSAEKRYQQQKDRLDKKEAEYNNKLEIIGKTHTIEKQSLQSKIFEANQVKSQLQKDIIVLNHQKEQITKQMRQLTEKFDSKINQTFYLNKNLEKITSESRQKLNELNNEYMNEKLNYEKRIALCQQQKEFYCKKLEDYERQQEKSNLGYEQKMKKVKNNFQEEIKELENKKNIEYATLESKYDKLKKSSKQNQQQMMRNISELQKQLAIEQEKFSNISQRYYDLQEKKSNDGDHLLHDLNHTKQELARLNKQSSLEISRLSKQVNELENEKNQLQSLYERDKILMENKQNFLEEIKQKNKKEYLQKIKNLEQTLETMQKNRVNDKNYYQSVNNQNINRVQKKYTLTIQENNENWFKREKQFENTIKKLQNEIRNINEKTNIELNMKNENIKIQQRKIKQLQQSERRASSELQKYKANKETYNIQNLSNLQREKDNMKQKMQQRQEKYKNLQKIKQQLYYDFQKQKARWNIEKQNYAMKNEELKEIIAKHQKDVEKLQRQTQKLKAEKKCSKMSGFSGFSRYSFQRANSKHSLQESINSINMSMSKQNCNPLGEISFFNNQD